MSEDPVEIPAFFETSENVCHAFEVPDDLKPKLLVPFLCKKARSFTARLSVVQLDDHEYVTDFILNQFKLTSRQYKARFDQAEKRFDETFIMFAARLRNNFRYYLRSREVKDDFERLCELIISDKLRSCLPQGPLNYVLAAEAGSWHSPDKVDELADFYVANHASGAANVSVSPRSPGKNRKPFVPQGQFRKWQGAGAHQNGGQGRSQRADARKCFICNKIGHIARYCVERRLTQTTVNSMNSTEGDTA